MTDHPYRTASPKLEPSLVDKVVEHIVVMWQLEQARSIDWRSYNKKLVADLENARLSLQNKAGNHE